ncbi:MAG: hypothetical protein UU26_C0002G0095 [Candidatus Daviesbacteria bacterium GW2011_GWC1_40_9]|nr:MAG: hypothetical protein UU26_C0002G0095 [Candidatus Daviesbacteria bacterium GW2011_GWC1_40_9]
MKKIFIALFLLGLISPTVAYGRIGVGVGTGKIQVEDKLKPGIIYELPSLTVLNTGDEESDYEVNVSYHEKQPQLRPPQNWFIFSPQKFHLEPGKVRTVTIKLNLPVRTEPGEYFAYLEGHPVKKSVSGNTTIGVAAAAKLYFTVIPGNFLEGIYYKIASFWKVYSPWPQRLLILLVIGVAYLWVRKHFNIQIGLKKPGATSPEHHTESSFKPLRRLSRKELFLQKQNESKTSILENKLDKDKND